MNEENIRNQICDICYKMWQLGWVAANDGNVSVKLDENTFLATPTGISKSFMEPDKLVKINREGEIVEALKGYRPSSEIKMHLRCYDERPDVGAVVHAHPPTATGFALAHKPWSFQLRSHWKRPDNLGKHAQVPVSLHNIADKDIYRPHSFAAFGTKDLEGVDFRACQAYGPLYIQK